MRPEPMRAEPTFLDGMTEPSPFCAKHPDRCVRLAQIATLGGQAIVASRGRQYLRELGRYGFYRYAETHHGGNYSAAAANLCGRGKLR